MRPACLAVLALAGCVHEAVSAEPRLIAAHREQLMAKGHARIPVIEGGTFAVDASERVVVRIPGNQRTHLWGLVKTGRPDATIEASIGELVANCGPDGAGPDCMAARASGQVRVGTRSRLDPKGLAIFLFGAAGLTVGSV